MRQQAKIVHGGSLPSVSHAESPSLGEGNTPFPSVKGTLTWRSDGLASTIGRACVRPTYPGRRKSQREDKQDQPVLCWYTRWGMETRQNGRLHTDEPQNI